VKYLAIAAYLLCIVGANWAIERYGFVSVGFGYMAPAGATLSCLISPAFALASGVAFLVSELADMAVYTPLYRRHPYTSVISSNTVGAVIDSWLFLWLAFGSIAFWQGNVIGKLWTILPALVLLAFWRHRDLPERVYQPGVAD
jgi:uncharacterized PurR-regulated membrane protein YhhQ (DUF165 family)